MVAVFFWLANLKLVLLHRDWPLLITIAGIFVLLAPAKNKRKKIIAELERGKITASEAAEKLEKLS
jgi:hypothetical protein